jgi:hypothetical protein
MLSDSAHFKKELPVKKNLLCILSTVIVSFASQLAVAASTIPPQPSVCPSVAAIKPVGVSQNTRQIQKLWFAGRRNNMYQTADQWTFIVGNIPATNTVDAFQKAMVGLKTLFLQTGPFYDLQWNRWICMYATLGGLPAIALNPSLDSSSEMLTELFSKYENK